MKFISFRVENPEDGYYRAFRALTVEEARCLDNEEADTTEPFGSGVTQWDAIADLCSRLKTQRDG